MDWKNCLFRILVGVSLMVVGVEEGAAKSEVSLVPQIRSFA